MGIPFLRHREYIIVPLQAAISDDEMVELWGLLANHVTGHDVRGVVIDVTALDVIDSFACRTLTHVAQAIRLRGAETVIVGIQPDVAIAMVQLGLSVTDVRTMLDTEEAIAFLDQATAQAAR